jgi:UDP-galactopyranose mutase
MYDFLIVGCGLYGSVFAQECIRRKKRVLILDKRDHIGGNCYTKNIEGINIHIYGPHIFHTNSKKIWEYVNEFTKFNHYVNRPKVSYNNKIFSFPINLFTLYQLWNISNPQQAKKILEEKKIKILNPSNLEEWILSQVGEEIYNIFIKGYTSKQWGIEPKKLPMDIIKRLPIRLNFDDNYFNDTYQGIPIGGYSQMIEKMILGADICLETDYFKNRDEWDKKSKYVVFTGRLDEFYNYKFGTLNYRGLKFEHENMNIEDFQGNAVINYTDINIPYTRIIEHKHFEFGKQSNTVVTKEYPDTWSNEKIPYYPINTDDNNQVFQRYVKLNNTNTKYIFGGRLAEYKYYDMHQVIGSALNKTEKIFT